MTDPDLDRLADDGGPVPDWHPDAMRAALDCEPAYGRPQGERAVPPPLWMTTGVVFSDGPLTLS